MENKIKNSIKIEFVDYNGDKHLFYNEQVPSNKQLEFIGKGIANFLKSLGWTEYSIGEIIDSIEREFNFE